MTDIFTLSFRLADVNEPLVYRALIRRHFGWPRVLLAPVVAIGVAVVASLFAHFVLRIDMLTPGGIAGAYGVILALLAAGITGRVQMARMNRAVLAAPWRQRVNQYTVSAKGITRNGALSEWDQFTDHFEMPGLSVVLMSPKEAVLLPHKALQDGAAGADMAKAIAHWMQGAKGC